MRDESSSTRDAVEELAEEFFRRRRAGAAVTIEQYAEENPEWAEELRELLPTLAQLEDVAAATTSSSKMPSVVAGITAGAKLGDYLLVREVGRGGMGIVFEAFDERLQRRVALKLLPPIASLDSQLLDRFRREASAAARLRHPGIVSVHGVGEASGVHYFAMEFVDGQTLDVVLEQVREVVSDSTGSSGDETPGTSNLLHAAAKGRRAYIRAAARLVLRVAEALAHAHGEGIVHRDIKPGNIMLDADGAVLITDFGLCQAEGAKDLTRTRDVLGTLRYMAPEQLRGEADTRSDLCSLGLVLYELLLLRPAYSTENRLELVRQVADGRIVPPRRIDRRIPRDLETIVLKATDREPNMRYASMAEMARDLRAFLGDRPVVARRPSFSYLLGLAVRRNPRAATAWATVLLIVLAGSWIYTESERRWSARERAQRILAERRGYAASIAAAEGALATGLVGKARHYLENCRPEQRGWEWHYLRANLDQSTRTIRIGDEEVWGVDFDAKGERLAVSDHGGQVAVLDWETGGILQSFPHPSSVRATAFIDGDKRLATCCFDGRLRIWNVATGALEKEIEAHPGGMTGIAYDAASGTLLTTAYDGTLAAWSADTGTLRYRVDLAADTWPAAVAPDGERVVVNTRDNTIHVLRLADGAVLARLTFLRLRPKRKHPTPVRFSPDGRWLVCADSNGDIHLLDGATYERIRTLPGNARIWRIAFLPDGRLVVTRSGGPIEIWNLVRFEREAELHGHELAALGLAVAPTPDGLPIVTGATKGVVKEWRLPANSMVSFLGGDGKGALGACALDERRLATADSDGRVIIWDLRTGRALHVLEGHEGILNSAAATPDGTLLVTGDRKGEAIAWHTGSGELLWRNSICEGSLRDMDFRADGKELVLAAAERGTAFLDPQSGEVLRVLPGHGSQPTATRYDRDGRRVVISYLDGTVELRDARSGNLAWRSVHERGSTTYAVPSPDGRRVACGNLEGELRLLDLETGVLVRTLKSHVAGVYWPAFNRDGTRLAAASRDGTAKLWDPEGGLELLTFRERPTWMFRTVMAPDDSWIAVTTSLGEIRVYWREKPVGR